MTSALNRRLVLGGATAAAVGLPVLSACASDDPQTASDPGASDPTSSSGDDETAGGGESIATTADVPVGGCAVFSDQKVVITQPSEGDFKAFSSTCTHQGCSVSAGSDGVIPCRCHGSQFSLEDGSVVSGPATAPLDAVEITVEGDSISLA
ncbi:Rieske (2Fe-2S) protein [Nocardioides piscis]|uniref:Cytochrome bc1 complex Rieske iron-sulfur subunit n=1 Tax=Nocardioides piscis TaxID=2714938 RepID=A0A6G7YIR7_9ACTN|nr:Rieske (2Fe-2S) protein [Nocardioides piscis]QIK76632.1 Rieske (2Fe-2S) protein [Nocardioides piscis]